MNTRQDPILIAGAGCAGLSLAVHLLDAGVDRPVLLVDPRQSFERDRTWCGFATRAHPFDDRVSHRWHTWRVRDEEIEARATSDRFAYTHLPADAFYRTALDRIHAAPKHQLRCGVGVASLEPAGDCVHVCLTDGTHLRAAMVFDSRPPTEAETRGTASDVRLYQQFIGLHVRATHDVFDPAVMDMMDFRLPPAGQIRFAYVLPYSTREAMVELTVFTPQRVPFDELRDATQAYLRDRLGLGPFETLHEERGVIPMTTARLDVRPHPLVLRIGLAGAAAKPSTGYAFGAIQRASASIARQLASGAAPRALVTPGHRRVVSTFLDDVFLCYLARFPDRAPALFARIFDRCSGDTLARFLTDTGGLADDLRMIRAMPKLPFVLEALRSVRTWARRPRRSDATSATTFSAETRSKSPSWTAPSPISPRSPAPAGSTRD